MKTHNFKAISAAAMETSMSPALFNKSNNVEFDCSIFLDECGTPYGFEVDGGNDGEYYAEGCIETEGKYVMGYDGVFSLPWFILDELEKLGYNVDEVK